MSDIPLLVSEIRAFLQRDDQTKNDRLMELATQYAEACEAANQRLSACGRLLTQGLRSEAIQQAEAEPNLLDLATSLDFPERSEWEGLADIYGLPRPPTLLISVAEQLNQAYAEEDPLRDLLIQHRRLALTRAPLTKRLAVLSQIAARDATNAVWTTDLAAYQKARLHEVKKEAAAALHAHDLATIDRLREEVTTSKWVDSPPPALLQGLDQGHALLVRNEARAGLPALERSLQDAFAHCDADEARRLRPRWLATVERAALAPKDPIRERMAPALEWLDEQDRRKERQQQFDTDVAQLDEAIEDNAPIGHVMALVAQVSSHEREVPAELIERYEARLVREEARKRLLRVGSIAAAATAAGLVIGWIAYSSWHAGRYKLADRQAKQVDQALHDHDLESARSLVARLKEADPGLLNFSPLDEAWTRLDQAEAEETKRTKELTAAIAEVEQGLTLPRAVTALTHARSLARTGEERAALAALERRREQANEKAQADSDAALLPEAEAIAAALTDAEALIKTGELAAAARRAEEIGRALEPLRSRVAEAGPHVRTRFTTLASRLDALRSAVKTAQERRLAEEDFVSALAVLPVQPERYATALERYRLTMPPGSLMEEVERTLAERSAWTSSLAECRLLADWSSASRRQLSPSEARNRLEDLKRLEKDLVACPDRQAIAEYSTYLGAVARRLGDSGLPQLQRLVDDPLISEVQMIHLTGRPGKERYYTLDAIDGKTRSFHYIVDYDPKRTVPRGAVREAMDRTGPAPQVAIAEAIGNALPGLKDGSLEWEATFLDLLDQVRAASEIDPILRLDLLDALMQVGSNGSPVLSSLLGEHRRYRTTIKIRRGLRWMDPTDPSASEDRPKAEDGLRQFPEFASLAPRAAEEVERRQALMSAVPRVVGWLQHGPSGFQCRFASPAAAGRTRLFVVGPEAAGTEQGGKWIRIGQRMDEAVTIDARNAAALLEGRLVFEKPEEGK